MKFNLSLWYWFVAIIMAISSFVFSDASLFFYIGTCACVILSRLEYLIKKIEEKSNKIEK